MTKFQYTPPKKGSMEYLLRNLPRGEKAELKNSALEGALAKMAEEEREVIENSVLRISLIKNMGRIGALELLAALGTVLSD